MWLMQLDIGKLLCNMLTLLTSRAVFGSYRPAPMATSWQLGEIRHVSLGGKPRLWRVAGWWKSGELWSFMGCEHVWWRYMYIYIYLLYIYNVYIYACFIYLYRFQFFFGAGWVVSTVSLSSPSISLRMFKETDTPNRTLDEENDDKP